MKSAAAIPKYYVIESGGTRYLFYPKEVEAFVQATAHLATPAQTKDSIKL
jgi:hypothetical protein